MKDTTSTVAAISTPQAVGGISVIRMSGPYSLSIADKVFRPFGKRIPSEMEGHTCAYGKIVANNGEVLDDVLLTVFRAPKSYTGEDTVEISCHGGIYVSRRVLRALYDLGAEPAPAGEFTKRAFLNGKLSLTQAEAVADIISAEGDSALKSANMMREGALYKSVCEARTVLISLLSSLAAWTDYPDDDIPETDPSAILENLNRSAAILDKILGDYDSGRIFREGIDCAIIGRPNVGKSTLMNALLGYERSIVTDVAGTTRDVVEESLRIGDVVLKISDTAGIRESKDAVEQIGVRLAKSRIENAELLFAVFDGSEHLSEDDIKLLRDTSLRRRIIVINKSDLPQKLDKKYFKDDIILEVSAKDGSGIEKLRDAVYEMFKLTGYVQNPAVFVNERQKQCCERARMYITQAAAALCRGETLDAVTISIDAAADALLELTGERVSEAVVDEVFSRFCVGK